MNDMYSAGFYPFATQEEKWAYWSRHININRYLPPALPLYKNLYELVKDKDYFVITTNVDYQFYKVGFAPDRIFAVQGDYGKIQCAKGCHDTLYDNQSLVRQMVAEQKIVVSLPILFQGVLSVAVIWKLISAKTGFLWKIQNGMQRKNDMRIFAVNYTTKRQCF